MLKMKGAIKSRCPSFFWSRLPPAFLVALTSLVLLAGCGSEQPPGHADSAAHADTATDALGRPVCLAAPAERVICSGAGCLRLLTYLQAQDRIVAVDSIERRGALLDARPYAIANPQFKKYPLFGEFRGWDNPELIAALTPAPELIFKVMGGRGQEPGRLQQKTGIPVIPLRYGNLSDDRESLNHSLRVMASLVGKAQRAEAVIGFFNALEEDLRRRTRDIPEAMRPACYMGGLAQSGPHGLQSTDPSFEAFRFVSARNVAAPVVGPLLSHTVVSKEKILMWDPKFLFIDMSSLRLDAGADAVSQLRADPVFRNLSAVREGRVYGLFPNNSYHRNFETVFANAYYVGAILYPDRFADVDPLAKAEEIATFLNGAPAFEQLNRAFDGMGFRRIPLER